jgi:hypothetical protein
LEFKVVRVSDGGIYGNRPIWKKGKIERREEFQISLEEIDSIKKKVASAGKIVALVAGIIAVLAVVFAVLVSSVKPSGGGSSGGGGTMKPFR